MCNTYPILKRTQYDIDKTDKLEKGIKAFPSIYIEGAAACGKTTAVQMLLEKHPEVSFYVFDLKWYQSNVPLFCQELMEYPEKMSLKSQWIIFENLHLNQSEKMSEAMVEFVWHLPENSRAVFLSREKPPEVFLDLLWKQQMILCPQQIFLWNQEEVEEYIRYAKCQFSAEELYVKTGGWAGCVSMFVNLAKTDEWAGRTQKSIEEYAHGYEMKRYIRREILNTLKIQEKEMILKAGFGPWISEGLCRDVWGMQESFETISSLSRKGLLIHEQGKNRWRLAPIVQLWIEPEKKATDVYEKLGLWYEKNGYLREALDCLKKTEDICIYRNCILRHYMEIPFSGIDFKIVTNWEDNIPENCYLRGMYDYINQDFTGLEREIKKAEELYKNCQEQQEEICREIYINLVFTAFDRSLDDWLNLLEKEGKGKKKLRLYHVQGYSPMPLCGIRDLSGLFACSLKEERRKEKIWKECLDDTAWKYYQLARIDYYIETLRSDGIVREDREFLLEGVDQDEPWEISLARYAVLCKYQKIHPEESTKICLSEWKEMLIDQQNVVCSNIAEALGLFYEVAKENGEAWNRWLRYSDLDLLPGVSEENFVILYIRVKGYFRMSQYRKAKRLLQVLIPYTKEYKRNRYAAELIYQEAIVNMVEGSRGQALRSVIESFLLSGNNRWVYFYTAYGKKGVEVLELYIDWVHRNSPEGWHRKKKYNYGNVVRMPEEDYLDVILRYTRKEMRTDPVLQNTEPLEKLTMMETIVLQELGRGLTNAQICQSLNLKITTVKTHIYSVYKKLGVNSRVQAVLKGKEMGIIR